MKRVVEPRVLYFGTPVVLISSVNADGTTNLGPMSSVWWLDRRAMLGMSATSCTVRNLSERPECVVNLVDPAGAAAVDRLALITGTENVPEGKRARGYRFEPDKFAAGGLHRDPDSPPGVDAVLECPINLEGRIERIHQVGNVGDSLRALEMVVSRVRVREDLLLDDDRYIDPLRWDPLIMKFTEYFAGGMLVRESSLARGWAMPALSQDTATTDRSARE